jgi:predicted  nucleic acid-binding Zn-ribbon protein
MLALQLIDSALDQIAHRRTRLPELVARNSAAEALRSLSAQIARAESSTDEALAVIERTEHAAAELTTKRERLERQLKTVISPREAEALMTEIGHLNAARGELDDQELAALEVQAEHEQQAVELRALVPAVEADLAAAEAALAAALAQLEIEEQQLHVERSAAAAALDAADLSAYDRARQHFGGVGVAKLEGSRCDGCHLDIARADLDRIRALPPGEPGECPQCARLLVR